LNYIWEIVEMTRRNKLFLAGLFLATSAICATTFGALEVLQNGSLEVGAGPQGWTLTQSVTFPASGDYNGNGIVDAADYVVWRNGGPLQNEVPETTPGTVTSEDYDAWRARFGLGGSTTSQISGVEHLDFANYPTGAEGQLGLLLKPQSGNTGDYENQNGRVSVTLQQVFPFGASAAGRTYTFSGFTYFQLGSSNNLTMLPANSPLGAVPSPTQTYFELSFLNASDQVLGTPTRLDLPRNRAADTLPDAWLQSSVMATAPAGTTKIRVKAAAIDMVASCTDMCTAGQDVFFDQFSLNDSVLTSLNRLTNGNLDVPGAPVNWILEKTGQDNIQFSTASYARHDGSVGMWLRAFSGGDAKILQTVAGTPGAQYSFSGWSKWETGYIGADPLSATSTFLRVEFLNAANAVIGTPVTLDMRTVQQNDDTWRQITMPNATAPAGTAFVRVSAGATGMGDSGIPGPQSAMFDQFSLMNLSAGSGNLLSPLGVPEPATASLIFIGLIALCGARRR
jgi:hypothetical protein